MNNNLPLVSIITPAYNRASYLDETIQSVLTQDYPNIEYIVLDDGSTDNTPEVLARYTDKIIWERHPNMGEQRTVNKGWGMTRGELVAVVNSDDPLLSGAVSTIVSFMQAHPEMLVAYPNWNMIGPDSEVIECRELPEYNYLEMLKLHRCIVGPGAFIRRKAFDLIGMRDPQFRYVGDFDFWLRLGLHGPFARIPKILATFRVHPESLSVTRLGSVELAEEHIRLMQKFYALPHLPREVKTIRRETFSWAYLTTSIVGGLPREVARRYYLAALIYQPSLLWKEKGWKYGLTFRLPRIPYLIGVWGWTTLRALAKRSHDGRK